MMKKLVKRPIAAITVLVVLVASCGTAMFAMPRQDKYDANKELLESLLKNRQWVIDTLVNGNTSNNPYIKNADIAKGKDSIFLERELLDNYQKSKLFMGLVAIMEVYQNPKEYLAQLTETELNILADEFGTSELDDLAELIDEWVKNIDELRYESILNDVLLSDYTSSYGETLFETDLKLETLRQRAEVYNKLSNYQTALSTHLNLSNKDSAIILYDPTNFTEADYEITTEDYVNNMLGAYDENLKTYLDQSINLPGLEGKSALKGKILSTSALAMSLACEYAVGNDENPTALRDMFRDYLCDDLIVSLNALGRTLDLESYSVNQAIMLEALINQKNTTVDTMQRLSERTTDKNMAKMLTHYADLCEEQGNQNVLSYNNVVNYMKDKNTVANLIAGLAKKGVSSFLEEPFNYKGCSSYVLSNTIAGGLVRIAAIVSLGVWLGDQLTGIKETSKCIYLCKTLDRVIQSMVNLFFEDSFRYIDKSSEENAKKVINDLEFLKKLRLFGEKTAFNSCKAQLNSWIGSLLSNDTSLEVYENQYQANIDLLLGCDLSPIGEKCMNISSGDCLSIIYDDFEGPHTILGTCEKNGKSIYYPEIDYKILGGVTIDNGTLELNDLSDQSLYIPNITCTGNSVIEVYSDNVAIGSITNTGTLSILVEHQGTPLEVTERLTNTGTVNIIGKKDNTEALNAYMVENSSNLNIVDTKLCVKGNMVNDGGINGTLELCGDGSQPYENGYFQYGQQCLTGEGTINNLILNNETSKGIKVKGRQNITESFSNPNTKLLSEKNVVVIDNCKIVDNYSYSGVTLNNYVADEKLVLKGCAYIEKNVDLKNGADLDGGLCLTNECSKLNLNNVTNVRGDLRYNQGVIEGSGWLKLHGDLYSIAQNPSFSKLDFVGKSAQQVKISSPITIETLNNTNSSKSGVTFNNSIYVTQKLMSGNSASYSNGENIILTETAEINGGEVNGSLSAKNWVCEKDAAITGTLYTDGDIKLNQGVSLQIKNFKQESGNLAIEEGGKLICKNDYINKGTLQNAGKVSVAGDSQLNGAHTGGEYTFRGDVSGTSEFTPDRLEFNSKTTQSFSNSANTTVKVLKISNDSNGGFNVGSVIAVKEQFDNNCKNLINGKNIQLMTGASYLIDSDSKGDVTIAGDIKLDGKSPWKVNGNLALNPGAVLDIPDGKVLVVQKGLISSSATINVAQGGKLQVNDYLKSSSDSINVDGNMIVKGDAVITSGNVGGTGLFSWKGDLRVSSGTWNMPNMEFDGKLPQRISGSTISVHDLTLNNPSKTGMNLQAVIYCYGEYIKNTTNVDHEDNLIEKK